MRVFESLRFRLIAAAAVWLIVALIAAFLALSYIFRTQVEAGFEEELQIHAEEVERITRFNRQGAAVQRLPFSDPRYEAPFSGFYWEVDGPEGVEFASGSLQGHSLGSLPQDADPTAKPHIVRVNGPTGPMIINARYGPESEGQLRFAVGTDIRHVEAAIKEFDQLLFAALGGLGAVLLLTVLGLVTFGMAPFSRLAQAMREVRAGAALSVEGKHPTEVQPLVAELNTLIKGQRDSLQRARAQAGNLAHALKSPLAIVADEAFQLDQRGDKVAGHVIADQCKSMQLHIDHHIARARAQAVSRLPGTQSNVAETVAGVVSALARLHINKDIQVEQKLDPAIRAAMDGQDLSELVANLIDNAFKYAKSRIIVEAAAVNDGFIRILVEDDGPGLPPRSVRSCSRRAYAWMKRVRARALGSRSCEIWSSFTRVKSNLARPRWAGCLPSSSSSAICRRFVRVVERGPRLHSSFLRRRHIKVACKCNAITQFSRVVIGTV